MNKTLLILGYILFNGDAAKIQEVIGVIRCESVTEAQRIGEEVLSYGYDYIIPAEYKEGNIIYPSSFQLSNTQAVIML